MSSFDGTLHAYLDPGTGSIVIQAVIAGVVGALSLGRLYWHKLRSVFRSSDSASSSTKNVRPLVQVFSSTCCHSPPSERPTHLGTTVAFNKFALWLLLVAPFVVFLDRHHYSLLNAEIALCFGIAAALALVVAVTAQWSVLGVLAISLAFALAIDVPSSINLAGERLRRWFSWLDSVGCFVTTWPGLSL